VRLLSDLEAISAVIRAVEVVAMFPNSSNATTSAWKSDPAVTVPGGGDCHRNRVTFFVGSTSKAAEFVEPDSSLVLDLVRTRSVYRP